MKKLFIGNLPANATNESVNSLFSEYGKVRSVDVATDIFSGKCRGFGFIEMEGHEARAAMAALDGKSVDGQNLKVREEKPGGRGGRGRRRR
jgi:RNA recognition motif-containing protein